MLPDIKNDLMQCLNILEGIEKIFLYAQDSDDAEEFYNLADQLNFNATLTLFTNIGEIVNNLSIELKQKYDKVKWEEIKGFRNRIVHNYPGLNIFIVYDIIENDLVSLKENCINIVRQELKNGTFDKNEFEAAKTSFYYRHIPFELIE